MKHRDWTFTVVTAVLFWIAVFAAIVFLDIRK